MSLIKCVSAPHILCFSSAHFVFRRRILTEAENIFLILLYINSNFGGLQKVAIRNNTLRHMKASYKVAAAAALLQKRKCMYRKRN